MDLLFIQLRLLQQNKIKTTTKFAEVNIFYQYINNCIDIMCSIKKTLNNCSRKKKTLFHPNVLIRIIKLTVFVVEVNADPVFGDCIPNLQKINKDF